MQITLVQKYRQINGYFHEAAARLLIERENHVKTKSFKALIIIIAQAFFNVQSKMHHFIFAIKKKPLEFK